MTAPRWLWYSSVPGMAVPGMACPGMAGTASYPFWLYIGHVPGLYFDYADTTTQEILSPFPGLWYTMAAVSNRAGLTAPPPDTRWLTTANRVSFEVVFSHHAAVLARGRAHNAARHAELGRQSPAPQPRGTPADGPVPERPAPSEYQMTLTAARARNADRHAALARGETDGG